MPLLTLDFISTWKEEDVVILNGREEKESAAAFLLQESRINVIFLKSWLTDSP